jgi:Arc/MetJ-type ribon-helix-helix transcriptional regulator
MHCIDRLDKQHFTLKDIYGFAEELGARFPSNRHIHPKIRQKLQVLRDNGYIEFLGDQEAYARFLVESGQYPSLSAVLQRGLEMLRRECEMRDAELSSRPNRNSARTPKMLSSERRLGSMTPFYTCRHSSRIRTGARTTQEFDRAFAP